ncbi:MAG TPA: hypothetical protein VHA06_15520, partial [Candidatus Angelobacter sp.]|nr:hypothetical protein [Candidatus Angelobacter sp.]
MGTVAAEMVRVRELGGGVGVAPVPVGEVGVEAIAATVSVTLGAGVNVSAAEMLVAGGTGAGGRNVTNGTESWLVE